MHIGLLLYPDCMPAGLFAFADLLHAANRRSGHPLFEVHYVAEQAGSVQCAHGMSLQASAALDPRQLDALLIPGFWAESAEQAEAVLSGNALIKALSSIGKRVQLWSYCTGVGLLAASGRLNGQAATVTWWLADVMRERFARVRWQSESSCVFAQGVATASGVNGYLPIAQGVIERHLSEQAFRDISQLMVLPRPAVPHSAFQGASLMQQPVGLLRRLHALIEQTPAEQLTVQVLADQLAMSERTLARKVSAQTGEPVASYARRIKLYQLSERLAMTSSPLSTLSAELGFSSPANLRRMFKALTGLTPAQYRQQYGRV
ncbi:transcriptional regulator GlxA family with amidase domain [Ectopseudomonas oleovorans]|uniref:Transcriptional regulator GlxA family with amidase domain n=1 Tax=Ectopseudomonas oleovorans TaxID=301 RepID=A0A397NDQ6_ECTOL|nr:helix-turn-helix domain-containing protein [Pseudomonas oleovorans]RIA31724.1 transcriptional regulator GlxA family with amidase domain [Pseudomonas oleovorans]